MMATKTQKLETREVRITQNVSEIEPNEKILELINSIKCKIASLKIPTIK